jgi:hypothetical protein
MADRYWVGGSGDWNNTAKWSTSSGGAGGASVPTSTDNVFVDSNSASGATLDIAFGNTQGVIDVNDFTINSVGYTVNLVAFLAYDGQMNITTRGNVYWNNTVGSGSFANRSFGTVFLAQGGKTVSINIPGAVTGFFSLGFIGSSGSTHNITMANWTGRGGGGGYFSTIYTNAAGTFNFNNSVLRATNFDFQAGTTVNAGSATFTIQDGDGNVNYTQTIASTCTFNADTSTFVCGNNMSRATLNLNGKSLYNLTFNGSVIHENSGFGINITTGGVVNGAFTADLTSSARNIFLNSNFTINGPFNVTNSSGLRTVRILSPQTGYQLVVNSPSTSLVDIAFQNIRVTGTAAPISGTRIGNLQGCSGITFTAPRNCYRIGTGDWLLNQWAATSGGSPNTDYVPLPQDAAIFDQNTTAGTHNVNWLFVSAIDCSLRTSALTLAFGNPYFNQDSIRMYGSLTLGTGITTSGGARLMLINYENTITITSNGRTLSPILSVGFNTSGNDLTSNGVVELGDALNLGSSTLVISQGTFNTNGYSITASQLAMTSRGIKIINYGSSTITLSSTTPIDPANIVNATFNPGTSTIICNATGNITFNGGGATFGNVSFTGDADHDVTINGTNTYTSFSVTAKSTSSYKQFTFTGNSTITGALTTVGTAGNRRVFFTGNSGDTPIVLNIGSITATDADFRNITVTGTAVGTTPTRAGNCGGVTGITFPAPKTVYWNLAGTQSYEANGWAATSGGSPSTDNFPLAQDTAIFDNTGSAGTVTIGGVAQGRINLGNVNMSARTTAMTLNTSNNFLTCYGNWTFGTGVTSSVSAAGISFSSQSTQTFTSNGVTTGFGISVNSTKTTAGSTESFTLGDAFISAAGLSLVRGRINAAGYNVTISNFSAGPLQTGVRYLKAGSGLWTLTSTGTVWDLGGIFSGCLIDASNAEFLLSNNTTTARSFEGTGFVYKKITIGGTSSTSTTTINGQNNWIGELASTKTVAHTILFQDNITTRIGVWSVTGTSGNVVTVNRASGGVWNLELFRRTSGIDYLNVNNCTVSTASPAEFYVGANSTNTGGNTRVEFIATPAARTLYWVGGTGNWSDSARWSLSSGGAGGQTQPRSFDDVIFNTASNATGYTVTIDSSNGARCQKLTMGAPSTGNITWAGSQPMFVHDDVSLSGGANITRTFSGNFNLNGYTSGHTLNTNGVAFGNTLVVNTFTGEWALSSAFTVSGNVNILVTNGSIDFDSYNVTVFHIQANATNSTKKIIDFGSGTTTLSHTNPIIFGSTWVLSEPLTVVPGTSTISLTSGSDITFDGNGKTFYNVTFATASNGRTDTINGLNQSNDVAGNTFNNLTGRTVNGDGINIISIQQATQAGISTTTTINGTLSISGASGVRRTVLRSNQFGRPVTISVNALAASSQDISFRDVTITGTAAPLTGTRFGDMGGNTGITMSAPKNVYRLGTGNWLSNNWASGSGGSANTDNFPLPQDTAIFDEATTAGTHNINYVSAISSINASARTSSLTLTFNGANDVYGGIVLGSGITVSGTSNQTFRSRGTQSLNGAGKTATFPIIIDSITGTVQLSGSWTSNTTVTLNTGILSLVSYTLTSTTFTSNASTSRTLTFGSGIYALSGTGTIWNISTSTNFTVNKGTGEILLTNTTTTGRTFTGSAANVTIEYPKLTIGGTTGSSTLSITGNNSFTAMASIKTVAHTIQLNSTNTRIGTFSVTGTSGNVVTLSGGSSSNPGLFITSGTLPIQNLNYLDLIGMAFYPNSDVWYVGANSTSNASFGAIFATAPAPPPVVSGGNMFLLFM